MILVEELDVFEDLLSEKHWTKLEDALSYIKTGTMKYKVSQVIGDDTLYICSIYPSLKKGSLVAENYLLKFIFVDREQSILPNISPLKVKNNPNTIHTVGKVTWKNPNRHLKYHTVEILRCSWEEILQKLESYL